MTDSLGDPAPAHGNIATPRAILTSRSRILSPRAEGAQRRCPLADAIAVLAAAGAEAGSAEGFTALRTGWPHVAADALPEALAERPDRPCRRGGSLHAGRLTDPSSSSNRGGR
jgi:hypothetical protein